MSSQLRRAGRMRGQSLPKSLTSERETARGGTCRVTQAPHLPAHVHVAARLAHIGRTPSFACIRDRISARLAALSLKTPRSALVTITLPCFFAPRIVMQV